MTQAFYCGRYVLEAARPLIMGIVNLTDDSFSGDGFSEDTSAAVAHALQLVQEGADIIDLGAESSRPGSAPISAEQEIARLKPVVVQLLTCGVPLSIDTTKPLVMRTMLTLGADMINDITALSNPGALEVVAHSSAAVCLMHMQGSPQTMQHQPLYADVVNEVATYLGERVAAAEAAGIALNRICVDPGFGFGKSLEHNLELLRRLSEMVVPGLPLLVGMSRKSMLGLISGRGERDRVAAGLAAHVIAVLKGARILRVHDVAATRDALAVVAAVEDY